MSDKSEVLALRARTQPLEHYVRGNMNRGNCNRLIKDKAVKALVAVSSSSPNNANAANVKLETSTGADDQDSAPNSVMNV